MGVFSSIGKGFKKIWSGIKKGFKKVMKAVSKVLASKLGKALMLAISIFTMGTALIAGFQGFSAGTGFVAKFVNGGKEFMNSLLGTSFKTIGEGGSKVGAVTGGVGEGAGAVEAGTAAGVDPAATAAASIDPAAVGGVGGAAREAPGFLSKAPEQVARAKPGFLATPPASADGWLKKAADAAMKFAMTDSGETIIGGIVAGAGAGMRDAEWMRHDRRIERQFNDPNNPGMLSLAAHDYTVDTPRGLAGAPGQFAQQENQASGRYTPTIPFGR